MDQDVTQKLLAFFSNVCFPKNEGKGALFCVGLDVPQQIYSLCLKLKRGSTPFTLTITRRHKGKGNVTVSDVLDILDYTDFISKANVQQRNSATRLPES